MVSTPSSLLSTLIFLSYIPLGLPLSFHSNPSLLPPLLASPFLLFIPRKKVSRYIPYKT
jgi:hypothetical protein